MSYYILAMYKNKRNLYFLEADTLLKAKKEIQTHFINKDYTDILLIKGKIINIFNK